ncbi:hypothetical protein HFO35_35490 [Rhizobium leguminosarum]|nr:hypothetical protein [Rhizobium leguminosarum]MBY5680375.1 hypothetical protein [Rhizobium leguminosarum]
MNCESSVSHDGGSQALSKQKAYQFGDFRLLPEAQALLYKGQSVVEFLTSNRGSDDYIDQPAKMPALGGASADPLRFLDFLIREPVRTMLLHRSGVPVVVPDPSRYAVHKLIVASRRHTDGQGPAKREKDVRQAALLFEALQQTRRSAELALVYNEAWERGPAWKQGIRTGAGMLATQDAERLKTALVEGAKKIAKKLNFRLENRLSFASKAKRLI